jgi:hypothetical protein
MREYAARLAAKADDVEKEREAARTGAGEDVEEDVAEEEEAPEDGEEKEAPEDGEEKEAPEDGEEEAPVSNSAKKAAAGKKRKPAGAPPIALIARQSHGAILACVMKELRELRAMVSKDKRYRVVRRSTTPSSPTSARAAARASSSSSPAPAVPSGSSDYPAGSNSDSSADENDEAVAVELPPWMNCKGCEDFECTKTVEDSEDVLEHGAAVLPWLQRHQLVLEARCPRHPEATLTVVEGSVVGVCYAWVAATQNQCRKRVHLAAPWSTDRERLPLGAAVTFLRFVFGRAVGANPQVLQKLCEVKDPRSLKKIEELVLRAAKVESETKVLGAARLQVDETYIGHRKYNRGKRSRAETFWMVSATAVDRDGKSEGTVLVPVVCRNKDVVESVIERQVLSPRTRVTTDAFKSYNDVGRLVDHRVVDHSVGFVNENGDHTNNAESTHSAVKREVKKWGKRFGRDPGTAAARMQLAACVFKAGNGWQAKAAAILAVVRRHLEQLMVTELDFRPAPADGEKKGPGRPRLSQEVRKARIAEKMAAKKPPIVQAAENRRQLAVPVTERMAAEQSFMGREYIHDIAIDTLLCHIVANGARKDIVALSSHWPMVGEEDRLARGTLYLLPRVVSSHWVLYTVKAEEVQLYNSLVTYARTEVRKMTARVKKLVQAKMTAPQGASAAPWAEFEEKECPQQPNKFDCGIFLLNNGISLCGNPTPPLTRQAGLALFREILDTRVNRKE